MDRNSHCSYYHNTTDFRKTNGAIFIGVLILIIVVMLC
jgi:hypothetical protein